jgi:hypothetical protein
MSDATAPELVIGGISSSALAKRRGLAWFQGYGLYLTNRRLIIVHTITSQSLDWNPGAGSEIGSFGTRVTPFLDRSPRTINDLERLEKDFDSPIEHIGSIELKKPGRLFLKGSMKIILLSGRTFNLGIMEESEAYGLATFEELTHLLQPIMLERLRIA